MNLIRCFKIMKSMPDYVYLQIHTVINQSYIMDILKYILNHKKKRLS